jgi:hypothetical protein
MCFRRTIGRLETVHQQGILGGASQQPDSLVVLTSRLSGLLLLVITERNEPTASGTCAVPPVVRVLIFRLGLSSVGSRLRETRSGDR